MVRSRFDILTLCLAIVAAAGAVAWAAAFSGKLDSALATHAVFASLLACVGAFICNARRTRKRERTTQQYLLAMPRLDGLANLDDQQAQLPRVTDARWKAVTEALHQAMTVCKERLQQSEHARAALEVRLRRSVTRQQQVEAIFANLPEPIMVVDEFDEIVLSNLSADQLFNLPGNDTGQRALAQLDRCQFLLDMLVDARRRRGIVSRSTDVELADSQGQSRWYHVTTRGIAGEADATGQSAVAILRDISGLKAMQKKNAEFVSAVSHEMKTPLAGIKAYVELLVDGDAEDEATREEFLEVINSQANRLQRLIDNLLNLARIEAGVVEVSKEGRSLNELLKEALSIVQPSAEAKNIQLSSDLSGMYLGVWADRDMMMQAAINLLSNAIKYTPAGGSVTLRSRLADNQVQFTVQDTGVGLSEEDCQKVFEKFYRVKKDREMAAGTGLGLALVKHIVEDVHSGQVTVESQVGVGSSFTVSLPCAAQITA